MSLRHRLDRLEDRIKGNATLDRKPSAPTCQGGCGYCFPERAPLSKEEQENLTRLIREGRLAAYRALLAEPDPRDLPCPACGYTRPVLRAEDLQGTAEEIDELLQGGRFQVPRGLFDAVPEHLQPDVYRLLIMTATCMSTSP
jgi:hypothetical protein